MLPEPMFWDEETEAQGGQELPREDPGWRLPARGRLHCRGWDSGLQS